jgi:hypothetical protein
VFGQFLRQKIDKKRGSGELNKYAVYMDVDKDGFITPIDLKTCIENLNSEAFFKNCGEALSGSWFAQGVKSFPTAGLTPLKAAELAK